uniref:Uncharacterized protein n=1 Tax=uncultured marine virus TaxID=186617 RepID=A0A0F7LBU8_9VIRU|nr:hypothetical protein [uncultured marine virus]
MLIIYVDQFYCCGASTRGVVKNGLSMIIQTIVKHQFHLDNSVRIIGLFRRIVN